MRDIKKRSRLLVKDSVTLLGVMDETGTLKADEIFVQIKKPEPALGFKFEDLENTEEKRVIEVGVLVLEVGEDGGVVIF